MFESALYYVAGLDSLFSFGFFASVITLISVLVHGARIFPPYHPFALTHLPPLSHNSSRGESLFPPYLNHVILAYCVVPAVSPLDRPLEATLLHCYEGWVAYAIRLYKLPFMSTLLSQSTLVGR